MKPIVHYTDSAFNVSVGNSAMLIVVDHPRFPKNHLIRTSKVVSYNNGTGEIETLNTVYVPEQQTCCGECY